MLGKKIVWIVAALLVSNSVFAKTYKGFKPRDLEQAVVERASNNKVLIGAEGREESDTSKYPFTAIGAITFDGPDGTYGCTGSMVAANVVLTNGHCVWDQEAGKFYTNFKFSPGEQGSPGPLGEIGVKKVYVSVGFQKKQTDIDFAFLVLDRAVGNQTGWFGVGNMKASWYRSNRFYVAGYGSNFGDLSAIISIQAVNKQPCQVSRPTLLGRGLVHNCDTGHGNSGSALFTYVDGSPTIVGVHFSGASGDAEHAACSESIWPGVCENYATKSEFFLQAMKDAIAENK